MSNKDKVSKLKCFFNQHTWGPCNCPSTKCNIKVCICCGINELGHYYVPDPNTGTFTIISEDEYNKRR